MRAILLVMVLMVAGCAHRGTTRPGEADYTLVYLTTGPASAGHTKEQKQEIFAGHMANMKRLADEGSLLIAGPFGKARNPKWRGIFVMNTGDTAKATEIVSTDPGVSSQEFAPIFVPMRASEALRLTGQVEADFTRDQPKPAPGEPPKNIRGYVMLTAEDADACLAAIGASPELDGKIVWWGRLGDDGGAYRRGIFILDAQDSAAVTTALGDAPGIGVDPWWSTASLPNLPAGARAWR